MEKYRKCCTLEIKKLTNLKVLYMLNVKLINFEILKVSMMKN